jgi:hypothetical protein
MKSMMICQSRSADSTGTKGIMLRDVNQEPLAFCTQRCVCKKHKIDVKRRQSGAPCFLYVVLHV